MYISVMQINASDVWRIKSQKTIYSITVLELIKKFGLFQWYYRKIVFLLWLLRGSKMKYKIHCRLQDYCLEKIVHLFVSPFDVPFNTAIFVCEHLLYVILFLNKMSMEERIHKEAHYALSLHLNRLTSWRVAVLQCFSIFQFSRFVMDITYESLTL